MRQVAAVVPGAHKGHSARQWIMSREMIIIAGSVFAMGMINYLLIEYRMQCTTLTGPKRSRNHPYEPSRKRTRAPVAK